MKGHSMKVVEIGLVLLFVIGAIGCATTSDLEQLREEVRKDVSSEAAGTREILTESAAQREEALAKFEGFHEQLRQQVQGIQESVQPVAKLPSSIQGLSQQMRSIQQAMLRNYQIEEAVLRERLKGIERAIKLLQPTVSGGSIQTSPVGGQSGEQ